MAKIKAEIRSAIEKVLKCRDRPGYKDIAKFQVHCVLLSVKKIAVALMTRPEGSESFFVALLSGVSAASVLASVIANPEYDYSKVFLNTHQNPDGSTQVVSEKIRKEHTFDWRNPVESAKRHKARHAAEGGPYEGLIVYPPHPDDNKKSVLREFDEMLRKEDIQKYFSPIFQIPQRKPNCALAKLLTQEGSAGSAETESARTTGATGKKHTASNDLRLRMGDKKRLHAIMQQLRNTLDAQIETSEAGIRNLEARIKANRSEQNQMSDAAVAATRRAAAQRVMRERDITKQSTVESIAEQGQALSAQLETAKAELEAWLKDRNLTDDVISAADHTYQQIIRNSPYHGEIEASLNDLKHLSTVLIKERGGAQGVHADSLFPGGSLLQGIGKRKQHLLVMENGFRAVCILNRISSHSIAALQYVRTRLVASKGEKWVLEHFNEVAEVRVWNYLCKCQLEAKLGRGALKLVLWPVEEGETLLVDNQTPHAGAPSDGPDTFRLHWYAYVRAVGARLGVSDGDQEITVNLLKHYPALCAFAQASTPPVFWSPAR